LTVCDPGRKIEEREEKPAASNEQSNLFNWERGKGQRNVGKDGKEHPHKNRNKKPILVGKATNKVAVFMA